AWSEEVRRRGRLVLGTLKDAAVATPDFEWAVAIRDAYDGPGLVNGRALFAAVLDNLHYQDCQDAWAGAAALVREVTGNPFHAIAFDPSWRTTDVQALARAAHEGRAFDRLPILADALEEAGCADGRLFTHLRDPGPHARGCWALDLVLGRE